MAPKFPITYQKDDGQLSDACFIHMKQQCGYKDQMNGVLCVFDKESCFVVGLKRAVYILSKIEVKDVPQTAPPGSKILANMPQYSTVFLPFGVDLDYYTILDPIKAPWFFTADLNGCDMFVATTANQPKKPLVFHSNRNSIPGLVENLRQKGNSVDQIIAERYPGYKMIVRVHWTSLDETEKAKITEYLNTYADSHRGIKFIPYSNVLLENEKKVNNPFSLIGHYEKEPEKWEFILKGHITGEIVGTFYI